MNRTAAGVARSCSARATKRRFSMLVPSHTLGSGQLPCGGGVLSAHELSSARIRSGRLVSTWKVCWVACAMTPNTRATKASGMEHADDDRVVVEPRAGGPHRDALAGAHD